MEQMLKDFQEFLLNRVAEGFSEKYRSSVQPFNLGIKKSSIRHPDAGKG